MLVWLKSLVGARALTWLLAVGIASFLLFSLFPASQHPLISWITPSAQADVVSTFKDLLERTGLYSPPQSGIAPTGRRVGGAGRGPICALLKDVQNSRYQKNKEFSKNVMALMPLQLTGAQTAPGTQPAPGEPIAPSAGITPGELTVPGTGITPGTQPAVAAEASPQNSQEPALIATTGPDTGLVGGLTVEAHPTFWFYVPYILTPETSSNRVAQFVLLDESDRPVWNELMLVELLENPRLVEYPLTYTLETGKLYSWYFSVICDSDKLSRNPVVRGWVQRVEPTEKLATDLQNAPRFEQYMAYAENGIWFEAVNSLVKIRRQFSGVNRDAWTALLSYFKIPDNRLYLESAEPSAREVVNGNQLPAKI